jgi:hypothetical protein
VLISDTIKDVSITFTNPPPYILGYVEYMWQNDEPSSITPTEDQRIEAMEDPLNFGDVLPPKVPFNFGYSTSSPAYTAGLNGDIMGDKKYFEGATGSKIIEFPDFNVKAYFTSGTKILNLVFDSPELQNFKINIFGLDGRKFANRLVDNYSQKIAKVELNELQGGFYIYEIDGTSSDGTRKRATGKIVL